MKRVLSLGIILIMAFSLAACTGTQTAVVDPTAAPTEVPTVKVTEVPTEAPTEVPTDEPEPTDVPVSTPMPEYPKEDPDQPKIFAGSDVFFISYPDGTLYAWGNNEYGQLGNGGTRNESAPVFIGTGLTPVYVGETVFAISTDNVLWGWGRNDMGQLGTGDAENRTRPVELMYFVKELIPAWNSFYALTESGEVYGWGVMSGTEPTADSYEPKLIFENVEYFTPYCMIKDGGELWIRRGEWMKLADGAVRVFDKGGYISYVERTDGMLCYINDYNELGPICDNVRDVQVADRCAYILRNDGSLWKWDIEGEYHDEPEEKQNALTFVTDGVIEIRCDWEMDEDWGYSYSFALKANGELWALSAGYSNATVGKQMESGNPGPECVATGVKKVITNNAQTFIIKDDGSVWATGMGCGDDDLMHGGLGDGTEETRYGFVELGLKGVCVIASRLTEEYIDYDDGTDGVRLYARTFAIDEDGRIWAWGWNGDGLLGVDSSEDEILSPTEIFLTKE